MTVRFFLYLSHSPTLSPIGRRMLGSEACRAGPSGRSFEIIGIEQIHNNDGGIICLYLHIITIGIYIILMGTYYLSIHNAAYPNDTHIVYR